MRLRADSGSGASDDPGLTVTGEVAVVILHWGAIATTDEAIDSVLAQDGSPVFVTVVDHMGDFPDATSDRVVVLRPDANLGFAGGNNHAFEFLLSEGTVEYVMLLNNDAVLAPDGVRRLVAALEADAGAAAAGPTILEPGADKIIWYGGGRYLRWRGSTTHIDPGKPFSNPGGAPMPVTFITGCALCFRASALRRHGGFDERFFVYWEDSDWCARVVEAGARLLYVPSAVVFHQVSLALGERSASQLYYMFRNRILFVRLHTPVSLWPMVVLDMAWSTAKEIVHLRTLTPSARRAVVHTIVMAYRDGLRGRYGARTRAAAGTGPPASG